MHNAIIKSFNELRSRGKTPNFIFVGGGLFQLSALYAFSNERKAEGKDMCGVVCDWTRPPHRREMRDGHLSFIERDSVIRLEAGRDFAYSYDFKTRIQEILKLIFRLTVGKPIIGSSFTDEDPLYFFYPDSYNPDNTFWNAALALSDHIRFIKYDEGLGTYVRFDAIKKLEQNNKHNFKLADISKAAKSSYFYLADKTLQFLLKRKISSENYLLFLKRNERCELNEKHAFLYKKAFYHFGISQNTERVNYKNTVIIVGFDFAKLGDTIPFELVMYKKIQKLFEKYDVNLLFRPHPAQSQVHVAQYQQLNMKISETTKAPLESILMLSTNKPELIIGLGSTSQVIANAFWSIPSISIANLLYYELKNKMEIEAELEEAFLQQEMVSELFSNYMITPETYEDLSIEIKKILMN